MINLSILGHIILDSESISRTGIEGNNFNNTIGYLLNFFQSRPGLDLIPESERDKFNQFLDKLRQINVIEENIKNGNTEELALTLTKKINDLRNDDSLLLPGGWVNTGKGHALIYEFEKTSTNYLFHIYNAGDGLEYHPKVTQLENRTFCYKKTFELPLQFDSKLFIGFIEQLLANQNPGHKKRVAEKISATDLYNFIATSVINLHGAERLPTITNDNVKRLTTAGQLSGTCAQRSIHQLLKHQFKNHGDYQVVMFDFQLYAMEDYLRTCDYDYSPVVANFLNRGVVKLARQLDCLGQITDKERFISSLEASRALIAQRNRACDESSSPILPIHSRPTIKIKDVLYNEELQFSLTETLGDSETTDYQLCKFIGELPLELGALLPALECPKMLTQIKKWLDEYRKVYLNHFGDIVTLEHVVNMISLFTIYSEILKRVEPVHTDKIEHLNAYVGIMLRNIDNSILKASFNAKTDKRFAQIKSHYHQEHKSTDKDLWKFYINLFVNSHVFNDWCTSMFDRNNQAHVDAQKFGLQNIQILKEQFIPEEEVKFNNLTDEAGLIAPENKNSFVSCNNKDFWIPAHGEIVEFDSSSPFGSLKYRILKKGSPIMEERFKRVFFKFQQTLDLETAFYQALQPSIGAKNSQRGELFTISNQGKTCSYHGDLQNLESWSFNEGFIKQTYSIDSGFFLQALSLLPVKAMSGKPLETTSSNDIQLRYERYDKRLSVEKIYHYRELSHIRTNLDNCACLSMEYFAEHAKYLINPNVQKYLEINLFQDVSKVQLEQFEHFFQKAMIHHNSNGISNATSIYLICLRAKIYHYLGHFEIVDWINKLIIHEQNPEFKAVLHSERFKILFHNPVKKEQELYASYLWVRNNYQQPAHQTVLEDILLDEMLLNYQLQEKSLGEELMRSMILNHLGINESEDLYFDIQRGRVFASNGLINAIPRFLYKHPLFVELGLNNKELVHYNPQGTVFQFHDNDIRFIFPENKKVICQKKIAGSWLTLIPMTADLRQEFNFFNAEANTRQIPEILKDADCQLWLDANGDGQLYRKGIKIFDISGNGEVSGLTPAPVEMMSFESPEFMFKHNDTVYVPRYGFSITNDRIDGSRLIVTRTQNLLPKNTAQLYCEDELSQQQFCRVPIQAFYHDKTKSCPEGHLPELVHDINNHINRVIASKKKISTIVRYDSNCAFYQYRIINSALQPDNAETALYLSYIYLVNRDYEKANAHLNSIYKMGFTGAEKELQFLEWILNKIPFDEPENSAQNPSEVACQLRALSIYTQCINQGMNPVLAKIKDNPVKVQEFYEGFRQEDVLEMCEKLPDIIILMISKYLKRLRHTPLNLKLTDEELLSITRYLHSELDWLYGAPCYLHQSLQLKQIQKHIKHLQKLPQSPENMEKLQELNHELNADVLVRKEITQLKQVYIEQNITITSFFRNIYLMHNGRLRALAADDGNKAMTELSYNMPIENLVQYFPDYALIACNPTNTYHTQLREFLITFIKSQYHTKLEEQKNCFLACCIFLYHVTEFYKDKTGSVVSELNILDFLDKTKDHHFTPIFVYVSEDKFIEENIPAAALIDMKHTNENQPIILKSLKLEPEYCFSSLLNIEEIQGNKSIIHSANQTLQTELSEASSEEDAGESFIKYRNTINQVTFDEGQIKKLKHQCHNFIAAITRKLTDWDSLVTQCNSKIDILQLLAEKQTTITKDILIRCYNQNELASYREIFADDNIEELHSKIHHLMHLEINLQQAVRLYKALEENNPHDITRILSEENLVQDDPSLMVFQYKSNILLRPQQKQALEALMTSGESIQKVTMGGGKSKVLIPCLAQKKANGNSLIIVEVPKQLLESNFRDLNQTSQNLFQQKALRFEFNRYSHCTSKKLECIFHVLHDCMVQKNYIITTGESMASLELKYLELLSLERSNKLEYQNQVYWSSQILKLLRNKGEAIIDEVHQALYLKKQLNYTMGHNKTIN